MSHLHAKMLVWWVTKVKNRVVSLGFRNPRHECGEKEKEERENEPLPNVELLDIPLPHGPQPSPITTKVVISLDISFYEHK